MLKSITRKLLPTLTVLSIITSLICLVGFVVLGRGFDLSASAQLFELHGMLGTGIVVSLLVAMVSAVVDMEVC